MSTSITTFFFKHKLPIIIIQRIITGDTLAYILMLEEIATIKSASYRPDAELDTEDAARE